MASRRVNGGPHLGIAAALAILTILVSASPAAGLELRVRENQLVNGKTKRITLKKKV